MPVRSQNTECTGVWNNRRYKPLGLLPPLPYELVPFILEQYVEAGQTAVHSGNVLLKVDFFPIVQVGTAIDLLLHYPDPVAYHYDLVKEGLYGHFLIGGGVPGIQ